MNKTAIIFGATGLIGGELVKKLLEDNRYNKVILIQRRSLGLNHDKLEEKLIDFNNLEKETESLRGDEIFCCLGTTIKKAGSEEAFEKIDLELPERIAKITVRNKIDKILVISSVGSNFHTSNFYLKTKALMENAVGKQLVDTIIFFRPSLLLGNRKEFRFGELLGRIFFPIFHVFLWGKWKKYRAIKAKVVASAMQNVANSSFEGLHYIESDVIKVLGKENNEK
ncbi:MAG: NAD-dependent epimerase/dehydratase family protein [Cytophagales bacterium]|nr:NAD-dependent epimerase/dehydratase family protein [Cytophagales bacterium]